RSRKGLTSEEFSGHKTISASSPDAASSLVTSTWFSNTARRCALKSNPKRGTLPWIAATVSVSVVCRSEEHTSELQSRFDLVCRLLLEKKKALALATIACGSRRAPIQLTAISS